MKITWLTEDATECGYLDHEFDGRYLLIQFEPDDELWFGIEIDECRLPFIDKQGRRKMVEGRGLMGVSLRGRLLSVYVEFCSEKTAKKRRVDIMTHCPLTRDD